MFRPEPLKTTIARAKALTEGPVVIADYSDNRVIEVDDQGRIHVSDSAGARVLRMAFDTAFRREIAKALPDHKLEKLKPAHPIYQTHYDIRRVDYTPRVREDFGPFDTPASALADNRQARLFNSSTAPGLSSGPSSQRPRQRGRKRRKGTSTTSQAFPPVSNSAQ